MKKQKYFITLFAILLIPVLLSMVSAGIQTNKALGNNDDSLGPNVIEASDSNILMKHIYIIHYKKPISTEKPAKPSTTTCYKTFSKWSNTPVSYTISTSNTAGLIESDMVDALVISANTWDDATLSTDLFNDVYNITSQTLPFGSNDGKNALMFGTYSDTRVIAVTSIYYTRGKFSQIYDTDILFNTFYAWSTTGNPAAMDLQNIATHELGHFIGLSDIYQSSCTDVTMYGYSTKGETSKRTLEQPDITGLQKLYGA